MGNRLFAVNVHGEWIQEFIRAWLTAMDRFMTGY
jgi:hypothetical protein